MPPNADPLRNIDSAERSYQRVKNEIEAVPADALSPQNVELMSVTSLAMGVAHAIASYRDRIAKLPETDVHCVDALPDVAQATWYLYVTNLPADEIPNQVETEVQPTRATLLMWAIPLAEAGIFSKAAVDKIREGSGIRDAAGDIVALVALYRNHWDQVRNMCGVTEEYLDRASKIGPAVFASVSRREHAPTVSPAEAALRVKKAWTLLDRYYSQCRRAIAYLRYFDGDVDEIAPNLRRNLGSPKRTPETPAPVAENPAPAPATGPTPIQAGAPVGGGASPFVNR